MYTAMAKIVPAIRAPASFRDRNGGSRHHQVVHRFGPRKLNGAGPVLGGVFEKNEWEYRENLT